MKKIQNFKKPEKIALMFGVSVVSLLCGGCSSTIKGHDIVASTGTVIGLDVSEDPATKAFHAKLGYDRAELAIVPTNRIVCEIEKKEEKSNAYDCDQGNNPIVDNHGAKDSPNVLMEISVSGLLKSLFMDAQIYQRLAVGEEAVKQAPSMFIRDAEGKVNSDAKEIIQKTSTNTENQTPAKNPNSSNNNTK